MSKKTRRRPPGAPARREPALSPPQVNVWLSKVEKLLMAREYEKVVATCRRILRHVPAGSEPYGEIQSHLGIAYQMLQNFDAAYESLTRALEVRPEDPLVWYNRAGAARYTMRTGQSVRDLEQALAVESTPALQEKCKEQLDLGRKLVQEELRLRGPDFTLDQLVEQQDTFQQGLKLMEARQWAEAEAAFCRVIEMADCLPQPHGNLAGSLIMQERYDDAEVELYRALQIDPRYELARRNLEALPTIRRSGPPAFEITSPFKGHKLKQSLTFVME